MKTIIIISLTAALMAAGGYSTNAKNSGQEPPLKKQTTCEKTMVLAPNFSAEDQSTVYFKPFPSNDDFMLACIKKEDTSLEEKAKPNSKVEEEPKEKVNQPIIGGFLGMILFEPNFLNTNQSTNPNKG